MGIAVSVCVCVSMCVNSRDMLLYQRDIQMVKCNRSRFTVCAFRPFSSRRATRAWDKLQFLRLGLMPFVTFRSLVWIHLLLYLYPLKLIATKSLSLVLHRLKQRIRTPQSYGARVFIYQDALVICLHT